MVCFAPGYEDSLNDLSLVDLEVFFHPGVASPGGLRC